MWELWQVRGGFQILIFAWKIQIHIWYVIQIDTWCVKKAVTSMDGIDWRTKSTLDMWSKTTLKNFSISPEQVFFLIFFALGVEMKKFINFAKFDAARAGWAINVTQKINVATIWRCFVYPKKFSFFLPADLFQKLSLKPSKVTNFWVAHGRHRGTPDFLRKNCIFSQKITIFHDFYSFFSLSFSRKG